MVHTLQSNIKSDSVNVEGSESEMQTPHSFTITPNRKEKTQHSAKRKEIQNTSYTMHGGQCRKEHENRCILPKRWLENKDRKKKIPPGILLLALSAYQLAAHYTKTKQKDFSKCFLFFILLNEVKMKEMPAELRLVWLMRFT